MKIFTTTAIVFGFFAITAVGDNCKPQLQYCGSTLVEVGDYKDQIDQALRDCGRPCSDIADRDNVLFKCLGGDAGLISFIDYCEDGCVDKGSGNSDVCQVN